MYKEYDFHLAVYHDGSEQKKEEYRQWIKVFEEMKRLSKNLKFNYAFEDNFALDGAVLSVYVTCYDVWLGIWDKETNTLSQEVNFEDIEYTTIDTLTELKNDLQIAKGGFIDPEEKKRLQNNQALCVWPKQIPNIRRYEKEAGINQEPDIPKRKLEIRHKNTMLSQSPKRS